MRTPVSYTHLDVYKRQAFHRLARLGDFDDKLLFLFIFHFQFHAVYASADALYLLIDIPAHGQSDGCLLYTSIAFAKALKDSGIPAELYETKRTVHGFEIAEKNEIVKESVDRRIKKLRSVFQ